MKYFSWNRRNLKKNNDQNLSKSNWFYGIRKSFPKSKHKVKSLKPQQTQVPLTSNSLQISSKNLRYLEKKHLSGTENLYPYISLYIWKENTSELFFLHIPNPLWKAYEAEQHNLGRITKSLPLMALESFLFMTTITVKLWFLPWNARKTDKRRREEGGGCI